MSIRETVFNTFKTQPRLLLITIKGLGAYQKIGKINDLIRRVSDTYFIVREKNIQTDGYHFHAIVSQRKDIKPNWFRKGIHINVQTVGDIHNINIPEQGEVEHQEMQKEALLKYIGEEEMQINDLKYQLERKVRSANRKVYKQKHIQRVIDYLFKEFVDEPFVSFILKKE